MKARLFAWISCLVVLGLLLNSNGGPLGVVEAGQPAKPPPAQAGLPSRANVPNAASPAPSSSAAITLTAAGFSPLVMTVVAGTSVTWHNATQQAQVIEAGAVNQLFLPLLARGPASGASAAGAPAKPSQTSADRFFGTLPPGGTFSHLFNIPGSLDYRLAGSPQVRGTVQTVTPDPAAIAPPLSRSVATDLCAADQFLFTGSAPPQTGVSPGAIDCRHIAVLRGRVLARDSSPAPDVAISILNHPEFGQTLSRADGMFDLAVNGGAPLIVVYTANNYVPVQRQVNAPWRDYAPLPDVMLTPADPNVTLIDLSATTPFQVARGSLVSDTHGQRRATLLFPRGVTAQLIVSGSAPVAVASLHVRATEVSTGPGGPQAMPATLPPASGYMFAQVFGADEVDNAGAQSLVFSQPLIEYLENYLGFPVGLTLPMGAYDSARGVWSDSGDGRVIKVLSITGGRANLDLDGSGQPASPAALAALGITDAERQEVATLYAPGQTLWRMLVPHFTPYDT